MKLAQLQSCFTAILTFSLLFFSEQSGDAQNLSGSFGTKTRFYVKCAPFEGEIQTDFSEIAWRGERISKLFSSGQSLNQLGE